MSSSPQPHRPSPAARCASCQGHRPLSKKPASLPVSASPLFSSRRRWIKQFMLGSAAVAGLHRGWLGTLLADISPGTPASDVLPIFLGDFPGLLDGSTPSIRLQLSDHPEVIMINFAGYNGNFYVLNARCTHQGCIVNPWDVSDQIYCPCHGSQYNIDGTLIEGASGPFQPGLVPYEFTYDGNQMLYIAVGSLNLKINYVSLETGTPTNTRLRLNFPTSTGSSYQILYASDLATEPQPVAFSLTATGVANQATYYASNVGPVSVWVDSADPKGFYQVELLLPEYLQ